MSAWVGPMGALLAFVVVLVSASWLLQRATGGRSARSVGSGGLVTLAIAVCASMVLLESFVSLSRPWHAAAAGMVAGVWSLVVRALFGKRTS